MVEILRGKQKKLENTIQLCYHCQYLLAHATPILWDPESTKRCRFCQSAQEGWLDFLIGTEIYGLTLRRKSIRFSQMIFIKQSKFLLFFFLLAQNLTIHYVLPFKSDQAFKNENSSIEMQHYIFFPQLNSSHSCHTLNKRV